MFADKKVSEFLDELSSSSPVPGGGSVAALSAALSASLSQMVCGLTVGKKGYDDAQDEAKEIIEKAGKLKQSFVESMDKDADSFAEFMKALKMPKETDLEKEERKKTMQQASKNASIVPLQVARDAYGMMGIIERVVTIGNKNAITDGAVSAMLARTAVLAALYNVKINLLSIKDEEFVKDISKEVMNLETQAVEKEKQILAKVNL